MTWEPTAIDKVLDIVARDIQLCSEDQRLAYRKYVVDPYAAPIMRYGQKEFVVVVARKDRQVIYWEDVEEGFNISPIDNTGVILEHWCNQDSLGIALNHWL